jgi:hypothetical protein
MAQVAQSNGPTKRPKVTVSFNDPVDLGSETGVVDKVVRKSL